MRLRLLERRPIGKFPCRRRSAPWCARGGDLVRVLHRSFPSFDAPQSYVPVFHSIVARCFIPVSQRPVPCPSDNTPTRCAEPLRNFSPNRATLRSGAAPRPRGTLREEARAGALNRVTGLRRKTSVTRRAVVSNNDRSTEAEQRRESPPQTNDKHSEPWPTPPRHMDWASL